MKFKTYKLYLKTITPIHIGSGEEYDPFHYVVKDGQMYLIDNKKYIEYLKEKGMFSNFLNVCESGDMLEIRSFIYDNFDEKVSYDKRVVSSDFEYIYKKNIKNTAIKGHGVLNQLAIKKTFTSSVTDKPIIPGSSIKGAIRTAILNFLSKSKDKIEDRKINSNAKKLEAFLLAYLDERNLKIDVTKDPLKFLKISDFTLIQGSTVIDRVKNIQNFNAIRDKAPQSLELISPNSVFQGTISISEFFNFKIMNLNKNEKITLTDVLSLCKQHYLDDVYKHELNWFKLTSSKIPHINQEFVLKLGIHTGSYAMTIANYRNITLKFGRNRRKAEHQTTTWKSEKYNMPLGWVALSENEFKTKNEENSTELHKKSREHRKATVEDLIEKFNKTR